MRSKLTKQDLIEFEQMIANRFDEGYYPYLVHLCGGNEDQIIGLFSEIGENDWVFSTHRSHYHYLLAGGSRKHLESLIFRGKSMFVFDRKLKFYSSSILAATPALAAGVAWALKRKGSKNRVWCFLGDGASDEGNFYEAVRYVDGWDLPCTFVVEDNDRSVSACKAERWGDYRPVGGKCVVGYSYTPTWPHGGTGSGKWLKFKGKPVLEKQAKTNKINLSVPTDKKYGEAVKFSMEELARAGSMFVGYNVRHGSAYGTLNDVPEEQRLETPVAENLMAGLALGMTLEGIRSVLFLERHDFVYNALDALVNQASKITTISEGQFKLPCIIRAVVGGIKPFYAGITHTSNLSNLFRQMFDFPVFVPDTPGRVVGAYRMAMEHDGPVLVSEYKGLY